MPARSSVAKVTQAAPLLRLATNGGKKCGLTHLSHHPSTATAAQRQAPGNVVKKPSVFGFLSIFKH